VSTEAYSRFLIEIRARSNFYGLEEKADQIRSNQTREGERMRESEKRDKKN
jgi:hypothetical protein